MIESFEDKGRTLYTIVIVVLTIMLEVTTMIITTLMIILMTMMMTFLMIDGSLILFSIRNETGRSDVMMEITNVHVKLNVIDKIKYTRNVKDMLMKCHTMRIIICNKI